MADLSIGSEFAGCRIEAIAGRGGMGVIYRGTDLKLRRPVAVKLIAADHAADPAFRERFERESLLTAAIDHPNVIPVYAAGEEDGRLYLVMRYVAGTDLHHLLDDEGRLAPDRAAALIGQVAAGLDAAHAAGLVHRDVKPANVLITGEPGAEHVYLSDFGITRVEDSETHITDSGEWVGTVDFMAPEHLQAHRTDARSDVYSLGGVLYAALTGAAPYRRGSTAATILAHLNDPPPRPSLVPGVPPAFDAVVARAMAKRPDDRYPSAGDVAAAALIAAGDPDGAARNPERSVARGDAAPAAGSREARTRVLPPAADATPAPPAGDDGRAARTRVASAGAVASAVADSPSSAAAPRPADAAARPAAAPQGAGRTWMAPPDDAAETRVAAAGPAAATRVAPAPPDERPGKAAPPVRRPRRRRLLGAVAVLAVIVGAAVVAVISAVGAKEGPLSAGEVSTAAESFARAYATEDLTALRRVLATNVRRVAPDDVERGRAAVLAAYRSQFRASRIQNYRLIDLTASGGAAGRATAGYEVTRAGKAPITGQVVLGVVRQNGEPRIGLIAAEPRG